MGLRRWLPPIAALLAAIYVGNRFVGIDFTYAFFLAAIIFFGLMVALVAAEQRESSEDFRELAKESFSGVRQTFAVSAFVALRGAKQDRSLKGKLIKAGMVMKPIEWLGLVFGLAFFISIAMFFIFRSPLAFLGFLAVGAGGVAALNFKGSRRVRSFDLALPILLRTIASSMGAGRSFEQSLASAASNSEDEPIRTEIGYAMDLVNSGQDSGIVYRNVAERMESNGFRLLAQAYQVTKSTGGSLRDILNSVAESIEARHQLEALIRALSAEGKLSALILLMLPPGLYVAMRLLNPDYASMLTNNNIGWALLGVALFTILIGMVWIRNLITFKD